MDHYAGFVGFQARCSAPATSTVGHEPYLFTSHMRHNFEQFECPPTITIIITTTTTNTTTTTTTF